MLTTASTRLPVEKNGVISGISSRDRVASAGECIHSCRCDARASDPTCTKPVCMAALEV